MSQDSALSMSPTEFEKYCGEILRGFAEQDNLPNFQIIHNIKKRTHDGTYQIDLYATFSVLGGMEFKILCECKQYRSRVKRERVEILHQRLESIGAQKGVLISTAQFQKGAIRYANAHGIALIYVTDRKSEYLSHSSDGEPDIENDPLLYGEKMMPPVRAVRITGESDDPIVVYPTKTMMKQIYTEMRRRCKETMGIDLDMSFLDE